MSEREEYLQILSEIILNLIILRKELGERNQDVYLLRKDYETINVIRTLLRELEELDSI